MKKEKRTSGIPSWPPAERPREKLLARGPWYLSDSELLAILLRMGTKGKTAVELAMDLLKEYGTLRNMSSRLAKEYEQKRGLGQAKAAALIAAFELGRRLAVEPARPKPRFGSSADAAAHFIPLLRDSKREVFKIAMLDNGHRLIKEKTVTVGTLSLAVVHPREVFKEAILENAGGLVLVHNHPGGDPSPSEEDARLTRQLVRAGEDVGIPVLDHIIIGADGYFSFADSRKLA